MIPDAAAEAAAIALFVAENGAWTSGGRLTKGGTPWGTSREAVRRAEYLSRARAALEAAAPHLMAECDGSSACAAISHIEGCFSTNPDYSK